MMEYLYTASITFDHVPLRIILNILRFHDSIKCAVQPAIVRLPDNSKLSIKQRKIEEKNKEDLYMRIWATQDASFRQAEQEKNVNKAHNIWCWVTEISYGNSKETNTNYPKTDQEEDMCCPQLPGKLQ